MVRLPALDSRGILLAAGVSACVAVAVVCFLQAWTPQNSKSPSPTTARDAADETPIYFERPIDDFVSRWGKPTLGKDPAKEVIRWVSNGLTRSVWFKGGTSFKISFAYEGKWRDEVLSAALRANGTGWRPCGGPIEGGALAMQSRDWISREGTVAELSTMPFMSGGTLTFYSRRHLLAIEDRRQQQAIKANEVPVF